MWSTTSVRRRGVIQAPRGRESSAGQVLVFFAGGIIAILAIAALVFDIGQVILERRTEQNAADAAALAGARFLVEPTCKAAPTPANCANAVAEARNVASSYHGFPAANVTVRIPPGPNTQFSGAPGHIEVSIEGTKGSFFAGVLGMSGFRVAATAVAANIQNYPFQYSLLALDPTSCKAGKIHGNGNFDIEGDVFVNSSCTAPSSFAFDGNSLTADVSGQCATPGRMDWGPSDAECNTVAQGAGVSPVSDPLAGLRAPRIGSSVVPDPPAAPEAVSGSLTSSGCPGSANAGTAAVPRTCTINAATNGSVARIFPGVYYGGINLSPNRDLTVLMEPGVYYIAGGGFEVAGTRITLLTVDAGGTTFGGGVMIWNTDSPTHRAGCADGTVTGDPCIAAIDFQNTVSVRMNGYDGLVYDTLLMVQDKDASAQPALSLTGNSTSEYHGTIYLPEANFVFEGNGDGSVLGAQVIAWQFDVGGNGDLQVQYDPDEALQLRGIGLVQ